MWPFEPATKPNGRFAVVALIVLLVLSFCVRYAASSIPGFGPDLGINAGWAHSGAEFGVARSYNVQLYDNMLPDHPPISIIAYTVMGKFFLTHISDSRDTGILAHSLWMRIPAITADLLTLILLFTLVWQAKGLFSASIVGFVHAVSPAIIADSAVWGQIDAVFTMFIVATLFCFYQRWWVAFVVFYVLAVLSKMQAIAMLPFFLYLWTRAPFAQQLHGAIWAGLTAGVVLFPFALEGNLDQVVRSYTDAVGHYPSLSMNAYNMWWLLYASDTGRSSADLAIGFLAYRDVGLLLFGGTSVLAAYVFHRWIRHRDELHRNASDYVQVFSVATLTFFAFFLFNTEMHERYLFPAAVLALPLIVHHWKFACAGVALNVLLWLNIAGVLPMTALDEWIFETFWNMETLIAFFLTLLFVAYAALTVGVLKVPAFIKRAFF